MSRNWNKIIADYESSKMTTREYCEKHHLVYSTFVTMKSRMKKKQNSSCFLPVICTVDEKENISFFIDDHKIEVDSSIDDKTLKRIIGALK